MEQEEFTAIVLPIKDKLFRLAKRLLVSSEEAEDAVQEVYLKLWRGRETMGKYKNVEAYAMTMTKNYCLDRLKSKQASNLKIVHSNYQTRDNMERQVEANDGVSMVFKIMETLPPQQKMILQLRDVEQLHSLILMLEAESDVAAIRRHRDTLPARAAVAE